MVKVYVNGQRKQKSWKKRYYKIRRESRRGHAEMACAKEVRTGQGCEENVINTPFIV